jgi:lysozyme
MAVRTRLKTFMGSVAAISVAGALAVQTVGGFEGLRLYAYRDVIGVWTACYGETAGVKPGMKFSKGTCSNMLVDSLIKHEQGMRACMAAPDALPIKVYVADLALTYNIGAGGFCNSTVVRLQNAGALGASCAVFPRYNRAAGRVIAGLVTRREAERKLCLEGI